MRISSSSGELDSPSKFRKIPSVMALKPACRAIAQTANMVFRTLALVEVGARPLSCSIHPSLAHHPRGLDVYVSAKDGGGNEAESSCVTMAMPRAQACFDAAWRCFKALSSVEFGTCLPWRLPWTRPNSGRSDQAVSSCGAPS